MTAAKPSAGAKALAYAEEQLGVHSVYEAALRSRQQLDELLTTLSDQRDKRRLIEESLSDRELEVAADERSKHPDMSQAQMDKHLKVALSKDGAVKQLRTSLRDLHSEIDGLECDRTMHETDIKIAVARLQELGGYFNYLAAIKTQAGTAKETEKQGESQ